MPPHHNGHLHGHNGRCKLPSVLPVSAGRARSVCGLKQSPSRHLPRNTSNLYSQRTVGIAALVGLSVTGHFLGARRHQ
jgi:hypothetical protein